MFRMPGHPSKRCVVLAMVASLPLAWMLLLAIAPLGIARARIAESLAERLGHRVSLGSIRLNWSGGAVLNELRVGPEGKPWLDAPEVRLDLCWLDLLQGRTQVREVDIRRAALRLERDADGNLNLLTKRDGPKAEPAIHKSDPDEDKGGATPVAIRIREGTLTWIDGPTRTELVLSGLSASVVWSPGTLDVEMLEGDLNGGRFALAATIRQDGARGPFRAGGELEIKEVQIDPALGVLSYLLPLGSLDSLTTGQLDLSFRALIEAPRIEEWRSALNGTGRISVYDIEPGVSPLVSNLATQVGLPPRSRLGSLQGNFRVDAQGIATSDMRLLIGTFPVVFVGRTGFDGGLDYAVHAEGLGATIDRIGARLPDRARQAIRDLDLPKKLEGVADLHLGGNTDAPNLTLGRPGPDGETERWDAAALERFAERLRAHSPPDRTRR